MATGTDPGVEKLTNARRSALGGGEALGAALGRALGEGVGACVDAVAPETDALASAVRFAAAARAATADESAPLDDAARSCVPIDEASAEDADRASPIGDELESSGAVSDEPDTVARALKAVACGVGREVSYSRAECRDLLPAWALTVHKAQGSEYRAVVLCLANAHRPLLRRELVYTAASRAKEALIVLAPPSAMRVAVETVGNDRRCTTLARRLAPLAPEAPACPATAAVAAAADAAARKREAEDARGA